MSRLLFRSRASLCLAGGLTVVAGCASNSRPAAVPTAARFEAGGNSQLVYVPPASGTIYISDRNTEALLYSGPVLSGDRVVVDPARNQITIDGQPVATGNVNKDDHRIYLLPGELLPSPALSSARLSAPRPETVPPSAHLYAEGRERLEYAASAAGTVWVTDGTPNRVVYRTRVNAGDRILVDPAKNTLTLNGSPAYSGQLPLDNYRIFFQPSTAVTPVVAAGAQTPAAYAPVPTGAAVVNEGDTRAVFTPTQPGTVWVSDLTSGRVLFSGRMARADTLIVDPITGEVTINGRVSIAPGAPIARYRVSFVPSTPG